MFNLNKTIFFSSECFQGSNWNVSGTLGGLGLELCYYRKASEQVQVGVELKTTIPSRESIASLGFQVDCCIYILLI